MNNSSMVTQDPFTFSRHHNTETIASCVVDSHSSHSPQKMPKVTAKPTHQHLMTTIDSPTIMLRHKRFDERYRKISVKLISRSEFPSSVVNNVNENSININTDFKDAQSLSDKHASDVSSKQLLTYNKVNTSNDVLRKYHRISFKAKRSFNSLNNGSMPTESKRELNNMNFIPENRKSYRLGSVLSLFYRKRRLNGEIQNHNKRRRRKIGADPFRCLPCCCLATFSLIMLLSVGLAALIAALIISRQKSTASTTNVNTATRSSISTTTSTILSSTIITNATAGTTTSTSNNSTVTSTQTIITSTSSTTSQSSTSTSSTASQSSTTTMSTVTAALSNATTQTNRSATGTNFFMEEAVFIRCSGILTNLSIQIIVQRTVGAANSNKYNTFPGGALSESVQQNSTHISYGWTLNSGQTVNCGLGPFKAAAQFSLTGTAQITSGDTYFIMTKTSTGVATTVSGTF